MRKKVIRKVTIVLIITVIVFLCLFQYWWTKKDGEYYYRYTSHKQYERIRLLRYTNTSSLYSENDFSEIIENYFDVSDSVESSILENSYIIPGLKRTRTLSENNANSISVCTSMTPQGITLTDSYVFISAYCYKKSHNSVIYMIDRKTHEFIKEIILPDKSHVGSIAYDSVNQNIWVCSYEDNAKQAFVCALSLNHIEKYNLGDFNLPIKYDMQYQINTQKRTSFMNYYDGSLYIGYFESGEDKESTVQQFVLTETGELKTVENLMVDVYEEDPVDYALPTSLYYINGMAQGMALDEEKIIITQSHGSENKSKLLVLKNEKDSDGNVNARNNNVIKTIELPVMAEDCYMDDEGNLYICFESAAFVYRARKCDHVDRIIFIPREVYS